MRQNGTQPKPHYSHFNPRTREGCDNAFLKRAAKLRHFNPRTREGCDAEEVQTIEDTTIISIHAPARGATTYQNI